MDPISVYILCGGKSSRMLTEKGLVLFQGKPFVEHIISAVLPLTQTIFLVTDNKEYDYLPYPKIKDLIQDKGPLGGIYTALADSKTEINLILSCDVPLITTEALLQLIEKHDESAAVTVLASESRIHPLIGIYTKSILTKVERAVKEELLKLRDFITTVPHQIISFEERETFQFTNINTPDELDQITNHLNSI